mmetsp:Transcript_37895/g.84836  ORF Transcript_37895/g.84836 Transcript_37895/m.84836 type:complete len:154 (+) Transcript_37895:22-483(+)
MGQPEPLSPDSPNSLPPTPLAIGEISLQAPPTEKEKQKDWIKSQLHNQVLVWIQRLMAMQSSTCHSTSHHAKLCALELLSSFGPKTLKCDPQTSDLKGKWDDRYWEIARALFMPPGVGRGDGKIMREALVLTEVAKSAPDRSIIDEIMNSDDY